MSDGHVTRGCIRLDYPTHLYGRHSIRSNSCSFFIIKNERLQGVTRSKISPSFLLPETTDLSVTDRTMTSGQSRKVSLELYARIQYRDEREGIDLGVKHFPEQDEEGGVLGGTEGCQEGDGDERGG